MENNLDDFLESLSMKQISEAQKKEVCKPIEPRELHLALHKMSNNKAPGSDGFPAEFLKLFWPNLKHYYH